MAHLSQKDWRELVRLRRAVARAEEVLGDLDHLLLARDGLCNSDIHILERLARKGARPVNRLAGRVGLTSGSMTTAVQRLRRRGLVETRRDPGDKRVVRVSVTREGESLAKAFGRARREVYGRVFKGWSSRECHVLTNLLKRLRKTGEQGLREAAALSGGKGRK